MKKILFPLLFTAIVVLACSKEPAQVFDPSRVEINGVLNAPEGFPTKTNYNISSGTHAVFSWYGEEKISRMYTSSENYIHERQYTGTAEEGATKMTFTGEEVSYDTGYALYPAKDNSLYGDARFDWYSNKSNKKLFLWMGENFTYNPSAPLSNLVPMVGKLIDGEFVFNVVSGVLDISLKNIPSYATKVTITSNNHPLSKVGFRNSSSAIGMVEELGAIYEGGLQLANNNSAEVTGVNTKSFTISNLDPAETYHFYFPIPAGALNNGDADRLSVSLYVGSTQIFSKKTRAAITIKNGVITPLSLMTVPTLDVSIGGTSTNIQAQVTSMSPGVSSVKFYAATDEASAKAGISSSGTAISALNTPTSIAGAFGASGLYYIAYQGFDSSDNALGEAQTITAYYLTSQSETAFASVTTADWSSQDSNGSRTTQCSNRKKSNAISILPSDDPTKGNVMLTNYLGMTCDVSEKSCDQNIEGYEDGFAMYGIFDKEAMTVTFKFDLSRPFYIDSNSYAHYLGGCEEGTYSLYASHATNDIVFSVNSNRLYSRYYPMASNHTYVYEIYSTGSDYGTTNRILWLVLGTSNTTIDVS